MMKTTLISLCALALASSVPAQRAFRLQEPPMSRVLVETENARQVAQQLERDGFDVLEGSVKRGSLELVVTPASFGELLAYGFNPQVLEEGRPFAEKNIDLMDTSAGPDMPPAGYSDLAAVNAEMAAAAAAFPGICEFVNLTDRFGAPTTVEGRSIFGVKISDNVLVDEDEPAVLVVSAHHCREIVTPVIALNAISELTTKYGSDPTITDQVNNNEIWIAPVWNPDGYNYVWTTNTLWRKNRRPNPGGSFGVDLNRNYPFGWTAPCSGSTNQGSETYKGPSAGSEPETQLMMAMSEELRFAKVIDYHSSGRETLWEYACNPHPLASFLQAGAIAISQAAGYGNANRPPSAEGEHYEWQLAAYRNWSFLTETHNQFQPSFASAQAEAAQIFPSIQHILDHAIPLTGLVTDAITGQPVSASIGVSGIAYSGGETNTSDPNTGRYYSFVPDGRYLVHFSAPGYRDTCAPANVVAGQTDVVSVTMMPEGACPSASVTFRNANPNPAVYTATPAVVGQPSTFIVDTQGFQFATIFGVACPQFRTADFGIVLVEVDSTPFFTLGPLPGPNAQTSLVVTNDPAMCGLTIYTQAKLHNVAQRPFVVTNAQDLLIGGN